MKLISPREYAQRTNQTYQNVYRKMAKGQIEVVEVQKTVKRIRWDDKQATEVKAKTGAGD